MNTIRFCIITCTYNAENVIRRTLDSVANQTWKGIRHIIIDGASTDNTIAVAEQFRQNSKGGVEYSITSERDNGLYDAMNKGLQKAQPDYVLFLNAGDTLHSVDTLKNIAEQVQTKEELPAVIYGDTNIVDATNRYVGKREHDPPEVLTWKSFQDGMLVCHQAFYVRTDIARKISFNLKYRLSSDVDWCIRVMKEADKRHLELYNMHEVLCDFLAGGMSIKNHRQSLQERFRIMARHYGFVVTIIKHIQFVLNKKVSRE